jgi:hypothetical protein
MSHPLCKQRFFSLSFYEIEADGSPGPIPRMDSDYLGRIRRSLQVSEISCNQKDCLQWQIPQFVMTLTIPLSRPCIGRMDYHFVSLVGGIGNLPFSLLHTIHGVVGWTGRRT